MPGVGKSCLLMQFIDRDFRVDSDPTIGVEFGSKNIQVPSVEHVGRTQDHQTADLGHSRTGSLPVNHPLLLPIDSGSPARLRYQSQALLRNPGPVVRRSQEICQQSQHSPSGGGQQVRLGREVPIVAMVVGR
jgi:hypothetical protein